MYQFIMNQYLGATLIQTNTEIVEEKIFSVIYSIPYQDWQ